MRRFVTFILVVVATVSTARPALSWEPSDVGPRAVMSEQLQAGDDAATAVSDGYLYLYLRGRATVKLFTILGQPVAQATLAAGNYRLRLPSRGIYLLKIGDATRRITL